MLPTGWSGLPDGPSVEDTDIEPDFKPAGVRPARCAPVLAATAWLDARPEVRAHVAFRGPGWSQQLDVYVSSYEDQLPQNLFAAAQEALPDCSSFTVSGSGRRFRTEAVPLAFPELGAETYAVRISSADSSVVSDRILVRVGHNLVDLGQGSLGDPQTRVAAAPDSVAAEHVARRTLEALADS